MEVFTALAVYTGARKAAMLSLKWDQMDFITGMIDYNEPGRTITAKRRAIVPMTADLREVLKHAHKVRQTDYVVEYGGKPVPHGLRWSFAKMCERAGLGWRPTPAPPEAQRGQLVRHDRGSPRSGCRLVGHSPEDPPPGLPQIRSIIPAHRRDRAGSVVVQLDHYVKFMLPLSA